MEISLLNPCSNQYHAIEDFKKLSRVNKILNEFKFEIIKAIIQKVLKAG
jgi:hypothetical protein